MKYQYWLSLNGLILSLVPLVIASCGGSPVSSTQPHESTVAPSQSAVAETETPIADAAITNSAIGDVVKSGSFASGEHPTQGTANLVRHENGVVLQLDDSFQTSTSGPDLVVALHQSEDVLGSTEPPAYPLVEGEYIVLAPLQSYSGAQVYEVPGEISLEDYSSAVIWCRQFNATFGAAVLR